MNRLLSGETDYLKNVNDITLTSLIIGIYALSDHHQWRSSVPKSVGHMFPRKVKSKINAT